MLYRIGHGVCPLPPGYIFVNLVKPSVNSTCNIKRNYSLSNFYFNFIDGYFPILYSLLLLFSIFLLCIWSNLLFTVNYYNMKCI